MTKISNLYTLTNYITANSSGNVVIAAPASGYALDVTGTGRFTQSNGAQIRLLNYGGSSAKIQGSSGTLAIDGNVATTLEVNASEVLRATSAGYIGIGTTSPSSRLQVEVAAESPATGQIALIAKTSNGINDIFRWYDGATQLGVFKNSGFVGIGNTSPSGLLHLNGALGSSGDAATFTIKQSSTTYTNGIYLERGGERNGYYMYIGGGLDSLNFRRNYFGTQSDVMSLTRDGFVGIGTGTPSDLLTLYRNASSNNTISIYQGTNGYASLVKLIGSDDDGARYNNIGSYTNGGTVHWLIGGGATANTMVFYTNNNTERMRITSGGQIAIGTSSPQSGNNVQINAVSPVFAMYSGQTDTTTNLVYSTIMFKSYAGLYNQQFQQPDAQIQIVRGNHSYNGHQSTHDADMVFSTNDNVNGAGVTERMRIWSTGELVLVANSGGSNHIRFINNNGAYWEIFNATNYNKFTFIYQGSYVADINPSSGAYTALSDERKKKDIEASNIGLSTILALQPSLFRMKTDDDSQPKQLGFIAQQVESVLPEACSNVGDYLGVQDRPIVAALVKAIQELNDKVTALESK